MVVATIAAKAMLKRVRVRSEGDFFNLFFNLYFPLVLICQPIGPVESFISRGKNIPPHEEAGPGGEGTLGGTKPQTDSLTPSFFPHSRFTYKKSEQNLL